MGLLQLFKEEEGEGIGITIRDSAGKNFGISWVVVADTTIVIKSRDLATTKSTITNTDFSVATPIVTWTPTTAQILTAIGIGKFKGFVHLRDNANNREVIAEFDLEVVDN